MMLGFGNVTIRSEVMESATADVAEMAIRSIAKTVPEECLCTMIIEEILERAKKNVRTMPITSFQQYLEENKR